MDSSEIRAWFTLLIAIVGAVLAFRNYQAGQNQRRLENTYRFLKLFEDSVEQEDLKRWNQVFLGACESSGPQPGHFVSPNSTTRMQVPFGDLFAEGPADGGVTNRMAHLFELLASEAIRGTIDLRLAYFQVGQYLDAVHEWTAAIPGHNPRRRFVDEQFPSIAKLYKTGRIKKNWPYKHHVYCG